MANQFVVGGDYLNFSALAQEESLIKRTNLLESLIQLEGVKTGTICNPYQYALCNRLGFGNAYQRSGLGEFTCLYSPEITVSYLDANKETTLSNPFVINVISSAAYNLSNITDETPGSDLYVAGTVLKIMNQLRTAKANGQRHLVLGAFGCGAFNNAPDFIASMYRVAINEFEFVGCFDLICFAIRQTKSDFNYNAFCNAFSAGMNLTLYDVIKPIFEAEVTNAVVNKMLAPFLVIDTQDELVFRASNLIKREIGSIHALNNTNLRKFF